MIVEAGDEMFTRRGLFILDGRFLGPQLNKQVHVSFCANKNQQELWIEIFFVSILGIFVNFQKIIYFLLKMELICLYCLFQNCIIYQ